MSTATTRLRVRFKETDQMGVVHHSEYPVWLEVARIEWLRDRGLSYRELEDSGISLAVSELEVTYRAAARFDDLLEVTTMLSESRSRRFTFEYRISRPADAVVIATATTRHVPTDRTGRAVRMPDDWLSALSVRVA